MLEWYKNYFYLDAWGFNMRGLKGFSIILMTALFAFFGVIYWPVIENLNTEPVDQISLSELQDLQLAESDYKKAKYEDTLKMILKHIDSIDSDSKLGPEWLSLLVNTSEKTFDLQQLVLINEQYPTALRKNEKASLLAAETYLMNGLDKEYNKLRSQWVGRENYEDAWKLFDADYLITIGMPDEGHEFLENQKFQGKEEITRLIKLALIQAHDNPQKALDLLAEASKQNPSDLDIYIYKFKLLENLGKRDLALKTYQEAILQNPNSVFLYDELAKEYVRKQQYKEAINTWKIALRVVKETNNLNHDKILTNLIFFDRMINGKKNDWNQYASLIHQSKPFFNYLINLKPEEFVNQSAFIKIPLNKEYLANDEITYWLSLLDALKKNDREKALTLIQTSPFKDNTMNPGLEFALLQALTFQKNGLANAPIADYQTNDHPLLVSLNQPNNHIPQDIKALMQSEEAFTAILLAAGWTEAALALHKMDVFPGDFPASFALEFTKILRKNRSDKKAVEFAAKQNQTADLTILVQEMTAKEAFENGNIALATSIYEIISDKSLEARSYLARKAFKDRNFELAAKLTKDLLESYPNNPLLKENLRKIQENI